MKGKNFTIPAMPEVKFAITHDIIDAKSPHNTNETHFHKECEIYLNLSGDICFEVETHIYRVSRGSVIITRPFEYHHCIYCSEAAHEHFWITFSAEGDEEFLNLFFDREKGKSNLILLDEEQLNEMCLVLNELLENEGNSLLRRIDFCRMLRILYNGKGQNSVEGMDKTPKDVLLALTFMDEHLSDDIDMKKLSLFCNVSVNTLERHFKDILGVTPSAMLRKKRLMASRDFLRNGDSVTETAMKSGFEDYSNYIQLFRKQFGITPLQYKKEFEMK